MARIQHPTHLRTRLATGRRHCTPWQLANEEEANDDEEEEANDEEAAFREAADQMLELAATHEVWQFPWQPENVYSSVNSCALRKFGKDQAVVEDAV